LSLAIKIKILFMIKKTILLILFLLPAISFAGGYQVKLQGNKQTGMGLVGTPMVMGASNVFFNPGGLVFTNSKFDINAGISLVNATAQFQDKYSTYSAKTDNSIGTPVYLNMSYQINEDLYVGLSVNTPFGSSTKWKDDWKGRYLIQNISLATVFIQPTVSYKITDWLGLGAGLVIANGGVEINKAHPAADNLTVQLEGTAEMNYGFNIGIHLQPTEALSIGIDYRSEIMMKMKGGDANFTSKGALAATIPPENKFDAELPMPANLDMGIAYKINKQLTIAAEVDYVFWNTYETLTFEFEKNPETLNSVNPREYESTLIFRLGAQYVLNDELTFRLGSYYDNSPSNDNYFTPETVTQNSLGFTAGITYSPIKNFFIDLSYLHLTGLESERGYDIPDNSNFRGKYAVVSMIPGIGLQYKF
jgi:long-chain fatty acid transport protein